MLFHYTNSEYKSIEDNKSIHLGFNNKIGALIVLKWCINLYGEDKHPIYLIINHEHGDDDKKMP